MIINVENKLICLNEFSFFIFTLNYYKYLIMNENKYFRNLKHWQIIFIRFISKCCGWNLHSYIRNRSKGSIGRRCLFFPYYLDYRWIKQYWSLEWINRSKWKKKNREYFPNLYRKYIGRYKANPDRMINRHKNIKFLHRDFSLDSMSCGNLKGI